MNHLLVDRSTKRKLQNKLSVGYNKYNKNYKVDDLTNKSETTAILL